MYASSQSGGSWTQREMRRKAVPRDAFFNVRSNSQDIRPMSVATEFVDTDWEEEDDAESEGEENSPRASLQSAGQPSFTTVSSYDEAPTPTLSRAREMYNEDHAKQVEGPRGPHLFYSFTDAFLAPHEYDEEEVTLALSPITPKVPRAAAEKILVQSQPPQPPRRGSPFQYTDEELDISLLHTWTPEMVAQSMLNAGMEMSVTDRLIDNDINGEILITLKFEDLRELDIPSFGIRTRVWNQIQALRDSQAQPASPRPPTPIEDAPSREARREVRWREKKESDAPLCTTRQDSRRRRGRPSNHDVITPMESVSIIGIEQVLPKPHSCSKGEKCSKWKKQQQMMEELRAVNPHVDFNSGAVIMYGDAGNPDTARALDPHEVMMLRPFSDAMPSVVASSDVLGPGISPPAQDAQETAFGKFQGAQNHQHHLHLHHDAQESVRQFLSFQDQQKGDEMPPTPPFEVTSIGPPHQQQQQQQPHQGLRHLPKLCIPTRGQVQVQNQTQTQTLRSIISPPSKQSLPQQQQQQHQPLQPQQRHQSSSLQQEFVPYRMERANPLSPDLDATATRNPYRFGTPFSEVDVPITTLTLGPVARDVSQSVPPDMNYRVPLVKSGINGSIGDHHHPPPHRQQDTNGHHRSQSRASGRRPSFVVLPSLNEDQTANVSPGTTSPKTTSPKMPPHRPREAATAAPSHAPPRFHYPWSPKRNTFEQAVPASSTRRSSDAQAHAQAHAQAQAQAQEIQAPAAAADGVRFQGPMKKRKMRMLRHEWQDGYFTLKGTRLNMHKDAQQMDRTLEYVDIDDYAIACSGAASTSKLSAAFKAVSMSSHDRKKSDPVGAFSFQLIPQDKNGTTTGTGTNTSAGARFRRRESSVSGPSDGEGVNGTGKTHHFAVKGRDERIDWMRELMLAKALKQKGQGFEISVNGNMI